MMESDNSTVGSEGFSGEDVAPPAQVASSPLTTQHSTRRKSKSRDAFRTISEVARELGVQQHVLRFWETKFSHVKPLKRGGGRRYYRPEDVELLKSIQHLLYTEGYTIKGVQKLLKSKGKKQVMNVLPEPQNSNQPVAEPLVASRPVAASVQPEERAGGLSETQEQALSAMLGELKALRSFIAEE